MLKKLWKDEAGIVALEYLVLATIVGLGLIVAAVALRNSLVAEFTELGNAITGLSQQYSYSNISWEACAATEGSNVSDAPEFNSTAAAGVTATSADVAACP